MTNQQFNRLAGMTRLAASSVEAARLVLVSGQSIASVANDLGLCRQCVNVYVKTVREANLESLRVRVRLYAQNITENRLFARICW